MSNEVSTGGILGILFIALVSTLGLGFGIFLLATGTDAQAPVIVVLNGTVLVVTSMLSWLSLLISSRLTYLNYSYYDNRFKFTDDIALKLHAKYIDNVKLNFFQVLVLLFKPIRYMKVESFEVDNAVTVDLVGVLSVVDNNFYIGDYYLNLNTDLFEYIDHNVKLTVKAAGFRQNIEKNIKNYEVIDVEVIK